MDTYSVTAQLRKDAEGGTVRRLSAELANLFGARYGILVDHGSTAIRAAIWALRQMHGMRALTVGAPCNVWRGVYSAAGFSGATRLRILDVAAECGTLTKNIDCGSCDVVVSVDGYATRSRIGEIKEQGVLVIEDNSLCQWPSMDKTGRLIADICVMSLQSNKLLSCGEGGLVLTDNARLAAVLESCVCDGRKWIGKLADEPTLMGFNGMMSDLTAHLLEQALEEHERYLANLSVGAVSVARLIGTDSIPDWAEQELLRTGRFFAVPIHRSHAVMVRRHSFAVGDPPWPPDDHLIDLLAQLPTKVELSGEFQGATDFAGTYMLMPHWNVAAVGRKGL